MLYKNWVDKHLHDTGIIIMNFLDDQDKIDAYIANIIRFNVKKGKSHAFRNIMNKFNKNLNFKVRK